MILVRDILEEIAEDVGGQGVDINCSDASRNLALKAYWEGSRILMKRGDFEGTDTEITLSIEDCCITLDRRIETIKAYNLCGTPGRVYNNNWRFLQQAEGLKWYCGGFLEDMGDTFATSRDLPRAMHILAYSDRPECAGLKLKVYGTDQFGREVSRHWQADKGFEITLSEREPNYTGEDSRSDGKLVYISALQKPRTAGYVFVYGYLPGCVPVWLTTMAPDETSSRHRRYRVPGVLPGHCLEMQAKVSLRWVKQYPGDVALIQDFDSLKYITQAINSRNAGEYGEFAALRNMALQELKLQRAKKHPAHTGTLNIRNPRRNPRNASTRYNNRWTTSQFFNRGGWQDSPCPVPANTTIVNTTKEVCNIDGGSNCFPVTAGVDLPGHRAVYIDDDGLLQLASPDIGPADGVIRDAVSEGEKAIVFQVGPVNGFSGLDDGKTYYLGANGIPTLAPPETGWDQALGVAQSDSVLILDIEDGVLLS